MKYQGTLAFLSLSRELFFEVVKKVGIEVLATQMCASEVSTCLEPFPLGKLTLRQWPSR